MAIPLAGWALVTAIVTITSATGFALYQLKATVVSVEEVFTDKDSLLNSIAFKALLGAGALWFAKRTLNL
jgi:hypothetical protein